MTWPLAVVAHAMPVEEAFGNRSKSGKALASRGGDV